MWLSTCRESSNVSTLWSSGFEKHSRDAPAPAVVRRAYSARGLAGGDGSRSGAPGERRERRARVPLCVHIPGPCRGGSRGAVRTRPGPGEAGLEEGGPAVFGVCACARRKQARAVRGAKAAVGCSALAREDGC